MTGKKPQEDESKWSGMSWEDFIGKKKPASGGQEKNAFFVGFEKQAEVPLELLGVGSGVLGAGIGALAGGEKNKEGKTINRYIGVNRGFSAGMMAGGVGLLGASLGDARGGIPGRIAGGLAGAALGGYAGYNINKHLTPLKYNSERKNDK